MNKIYLSFTILVLLSLECFGQENIDPETTRIVINNSIGLGSVIAVVISWERNRSVLLAILHGIIGWLYVIYFLINRTADERAS